MRILFFFIVLILVLLCNCKQSNKLAQDESQLIKQVAESESTSGDINKIKENQPAGQSQKKLKENRSIDKLNPPVILDIIAARKNIKKFTLKDLNLKISYIPIRFPEKQDSIWDKLTEFDFQITPHAIVASNFSYGIAQFDISGNFIKQIAKNEFYYSYLPDKKIPLISAEDRKNYKGSPGQVFTDGDQIYYQNVDLVNHTGWMMSYDASPGNISAQLNNSLEGNQMNSLGKKLFAFKIDDIKLTVAALWDQENLMTFFGKPLFPINKDQWGYSEDKLNSSTSGSFLIVKSLSGDTVCSFKDNDPIRNYTESLYNIADDGNQYYFNGIQHIRQEYNDTIYGIPQANRLVPEYILEFGDRGIKSAMEGFSFSNNLKDKFIINDIVETNDYIFIVYTQDDVGPNSARNGTLKYNTCIYQKSNRELFHVYIDKKPYQFPGQRLPIPPIGYLVNDLDHGQYFWPKHSTESGLPYTWFKGRDLKIIIGDLGEMRSSFPPGLTSIISRMQDDDYLIMILN